MGDIASLFLQLDFSM